jgi:hypothetical protein
MWDEVEELEEAGADGTPSGEEAGAITAEAVEDEIVRSESVEGRSSGKVAGCEDREVRAAELRIAVLALELASDDSLDFLPAA